MTDNKTPRERTIGTRYPEDRISLLDAISKRRGDESRADTIRWALDELLEHHFPGWRADR